ENSAEPLIILADRTDSDPGFRTALENLPMPYLLARIDREGQLTLVRRSRMGDDDRLHQQKLVFVDRKTLSSSPAQDLPLYETKDYPKPLRLSVDFDFQWFAPADSVLWTVERRSCRVLLFDDAWLGAVEVGRIPRGSKVLAGWAQDDQLRLLYVTPDETAHVLIHFKRHGGSQSHSLEAGNWTYAFDQNQLHLLLRIGDVEITFINPFNGKAIATLESNGRHNLRTRHRNGNFFTSGDGSNRLLAAGYVAGRASWHDLGRCPGIIGVATRNDQGQPVAFSKSLDWRVTFAGDKREETQLDDLGIEFTEPAELISSPGKDGNVVVRVPDPTFRERPMFHRDHACVSLGLKGRGSEIISGSGWEAAASARGIGGLGTRRSVRSKILGIAITEEHLFLKKQENVYLKFAKSDNGNVCLKRCEVPAKSCDVEFSKLDANGSRERAWRIKRATFVAGSAWLDRRGMIHLHRDSDKSELSLVLYDEHVSGWLSADNICFGEDYFVGSNSMAGRDEALQWLARFLSEVAEANQTLS
ncbi:MAG: hypothetical protein AAF483_07035, partial [Planctomycetota bacterium]